MKQNDYTGDTVKNHFTAYLQESVRRKRQKYLNRKEIINYVERMLENGIYENSMSAEEMLEAKQHEYLLLREVRSDYPNWNELTDRRLIDSLMKLREDERKIIYQHVFEELPFKDISRSNGLSDAKVKGIYYYAIRKIRKWMEGEK